MYKISISKELFDEILFKKTNILKKTKNKYWGKELLEPRIINDKIFYSLKHIEKLTITNGLGKDRPQFIIECQKIDYDAGQNCFIFHLGKILEQKNTMNENDYKNTLIERLLHEKRQLEDKFKFLKENYGLDI